MTNPLPFELQIFACATLLAFSGCVLYLVRLQRLSLRDSLVWLLSTGVVIVFTIFPRLLQDLAHAIGVRVPSNALFALSILYLTFNVLSLTIVLSKESTRTRRLAQEFAQLRAELDGMRVRLERLVPS